MKRNVPDNPRVFGGPESAPLIPASGPRLLIVILNYNGIEDTLACLESLRGQTCRDFTALVIDNGSTADNLGRITLAFPEVEVIALTENLGWAGGNNIGMRVALDRGHSYVCLLNNDTKLDPTTIQELFVAAAVIGEPCLLHPAIAYFDEPSRWQLNPRPPTSGSVAMELAARHGIVEFDWAYGACLLLPAEVLRTVGLLDERFFLQLEETDYFHRAKALGMRSFCATRARILHKESASFGARATAGKTYYQVRNTLLLTEKHSPTPGGFLRTLRRMMWTLRRQAQDSGADIGGWSGFPRWLLSADPLARAARQGARDYLCRRFGRGPAAGTAAP